MFNPLALLISHKSKLIQTVGAYYLALSHKSTLASYCLALLHPWRTHMVSSLRSSRDRERSSRDRSRERDRRDGMNGRSDSRRADDRDMGDLWRPISINHGTHPPSVSLTCLSIYQNLMLPTVLSFAPLFSRPPPFSFALTVNAADSECTWNIVWIRFSSIQIWEDCIGWED